MRKIRTSAAWLDQRTPDAERCNLLEETFYTPFRRMVYRGTRRSRLAAQTCELEAARRLAAAYAGARHG